MVTKAAVITVLVASLIIVSICAIFYTEMPITASPETMILNAGDVPGWEPTNITGDFGFGYGYHGNPLKSLSDSYRNFYNESPTSAISIVVKSFRLNLDAENFFYALTVGSGFQAPNRSINGVDEQAVLSYSTPIHNHSNCSQFQTGYYWYFDFRIDNVVVIMGFGQYQSQIQEWMNQLISTQVQKILQFSLGN
jgi:hypothetical protein